MAFFTGIEDLTFLWTIIMLSVAVVCFVVSEITRNYSQVDKLWSLMPLVYGLITFISYPSPRLVIMLVLVTIWGLRLSFNFYRKGGYNKIPWKGEEDYRWKIMRDHPWLRGRVRFGLFNLLFISFYQNLIILLFSTPLLVAAKYKNSPLNLMDIIAAMLILLFIFIETKADNQQYRFQKLKRQAAGSDPLQSKSDIKGFISDGLWRFVRHPNFVAEQAIWVTFYLFSVAASGIWINWALLGPVLLILLFMGSSELTERISISKYPDYADYKEEVPRFLPRFTIKRGVKREDVVQ